MKTLIPALIALLITGKLAAQAIPNGSFENWNTKTWSAPQYYNTPNAQIITQLPGGTANVINVTGWNPPNVRGVQLTTEGIDGDTIPAYITNSVGNPLLGIGGIPYDQMPTGIEFWYHCNEMPGDSGGIIVAFKKGGSIVAKYTYAVTGTVTGYPLLSETFSPALTVAPDTVIFAATSGIAILRGYNGIPGSTFTISGVTLLGASQPAELNGNFTSWVSDTAFSPVGWNAPFPGASRSNNAYSGNYSLQLQTTLNDNKSPVAIPGLATTGIVGDTGVLGGLPYNNQVDTLDFYFEYTPAIGSGDEGFIDLRFKKAGKKISEQGSVIPAKSGSWGHGETFINVPSVPDSVVVSLFSTGSSGGSIPLADVGSTLWVDAVQFRSQPLATGIKPVLMADNTLLIFPNPSVTQFTISSAQSAINEVRLQNVLGQTVLYELYGQSDATMRENINVSNLPSGLYFITVKSGDKLSTGKITISR